MAKRINIEKTRANFMEKVLSGYYNKQKGVVSNRVTEEDDDYKSVFGDEAIEILYGKENVVWEEY